MFGQPVTRALAAMLLVSAPLAAQGTLGAYAPTTAKYHITAVQGTSQIMMGQTQEFEATTNQLLSLAVAKSASALTLTMTLDSVTVSTNAPTGAPNVSEAIGLKFVGEMALDGKIGSSQVTNSAGAPSTSQFASNMRSLLPRLHVGAAKGDTWLDSTSAVIRQGEADINTESVVTYTFAGDTVLAGVKGWKITGVGVTKLSGRGNQQGADFTITGTAKGIVTAVVSTAGVLLGASTDADSNLSVVVEAAGMTIPIVQHGTVKVEKLP